MYLFKETKEQSGRVKQFVPTLNIVAQKVNVPKILSKRKIKINPPLRLKWQPCFWSAVLEYAPVFHIPLGNI